MRSEKMIVPGLVSIVVPVYNVEGYLDECVKSILGQTYGKLELILIDDGSPDDCPAMCDLWAKKDERIKVVHKKNGGLSAARNVGLDEAGGEFILFVDSDDIIECNLVEKSLLRMEEDQTDGCFFKYALFNQDISRAWPYPESTSFPQDGVYTGGEMLWHIFHQNVHNYAQMHIIKSKVYHSVDFRFPCGRNMEDMATTFLLVGEGSRYSTLNQALYYYRQREGSLVSFWCHQLTADTILALKDMVAYTVSNYPEYGVDVLNYAIKFGFYCWMKEPKIDASGESLRVRRNMCREFIKESVRTLGVCKLNRGNLVKLLALSLGLLGVGSGFRNYIRLD